MATKVTLLNYSLKWGFNENFILVFVNVGSEFDLNSKATWELN